MTHPGVALAGIAGGEDQVVTRSHDHTVKLNNVQICASLISDRRPLHASRVRVEAEVSEAWRWRVVLCYLAFLSVRPTGGQPFNFILQRWRSADSCARNQNAEYLFSVCGGCVVQLKIYCLLIAKRGKRRQESDVTRSRRRAGGRVARRCTGLLMSFFSCPTAPFLKYRKEYLFRYRVTDFHNLLS